MLDRKLQKRLLNKLKDEYPLYRAGLFSSENIRSAQSINLHYLEEHGLVELERSRPKFLSGNANPALATRSAEPLTGAAKITNRGWDFIENDGGLSAILDTVTVKLHADTIRDLIDTKIVESNAIPEQEKPALREALKGMKEEGLKQLTTRVISYGLDQGAITAQQLGQWLNS